MVFYLFDSHVFLQKHFTSSLQCPIFDYYILPLLYSNINYLYYIFAFKITLNSSGHILRHHETLTFYHYSKAINWIQHNFLSEVQSPYLQDSGKSQY